MTAYSLPHICLYCLMPVSESNPTASSYRDELHRISGYRFDLLPEYEGRRVCDRCEGAGMTWAFNEKLKREISQMAAEE